jgi:hypothetical protein
MQFRACPVHTFQVTDMLICGHACRKFRQLAQRLAREVVVEDLVHKKLEELRVLGWEQICALPASKVEQVHIDGKDITVCVWHDVLPTGAHRVVVQAIKERWGGITAKVIARGFELSSNRSLRTLTPEELYDFT